ncbi:MAG: hypothetical protein J6N78_01975 [Clostridia bacterium]|nr:hypothetical protein [Clostridia bacterium]
MGKKTSNVFVVVKHIVPMYINTVPEVNVFNEFNQANQFVLDEIEEYKKEHKDFEINSNQLDNCITRKVKSSDDHHFYYEWIIFNKNLITKYDGGTRSLDS